MAMDNRELWSLVHYVRTLPNATYTPPAPPAPAAEEASEAAEVTP